MMPEPLRVGIVGRQYGKAVLMPAFETDLRCAVTSIAGGDEWREMIPTVDVVAIAVPPHEQLAIASFALDAGKPCFLEKPLAGNLLAAEVLVDKVMEMGLPVAVDFNIPEFAAWQRFKDWLSALGPIRSVSVTWLMENGTVAANDTRSWKSDVLLNFGSHVFYYLEWLFGRIASVRCSLAGTPQHPDWHTQAAMIAKFEAGPLASIHINCAAYAGPGHKIEVFGENGTLTLTNEHSPYNRRFELFFVQRGSKTERVKLRVDDATEGNFRDARAAASARIVKRFIGAVLGDCPVTPGVEAGLRVQQLIHAANLDHDGFCK